MPHATPFHVTSYILLYTLGLPPPVTVTTRIVTFLVGNPYKPSFATVTGWGVDPIYTIQDWRFSPMATSLFPPCCQPRSLPLFFEARPGRCWSADWGKGVIGASDQVQVDSYNSISCFFSKKCFLESSQHGAGEFNWEYFVWRDFDMKNNISI